MRRKEREAQGRLNGLPALPHGNLCPHCGRVCGSRIGLFSHMRTHECLMLGLILAVISEDNHIRMRMIAGDDDESLVEHFEFKTRIGYETAIDLAKRGARVILACRDEKRAKHAVEKIIKETDNSNVCYKILDLASLKSVRLFAEEIKKSEPKLDILINNAGSCGLHGNSEDGLNLQMQANYFGHFLLTNLLLDLLKKSAPSRIVNVAALAAKITTLKVPDDIEDVDDCSIPEFKHYAKTKLCNILFTIELNSRLRGTKVATYSLHPGVIMTEFTRKLNGLLKVTLEGVLKCFFKDATEGAQTTIYCAIQKGTEELSGEHFEDCHLVKKYASANDEGLAKKLWEKTEDLIKLKEN